MALTADFPRTTYVLASDPSVVADALTEEYGSQDKQAGFKFLEKIVHIPLPIPQVGQRDLRLICAEDIDAALRGAGIALDDADVSKLSKDLVDCVEPLLQTARTAKRIGRVLDFVEPT